MRWLRTDKKNKQIFIMGTGAIALSLCNIIIFDHAIASVFLYVVGSMTYSIYLFLQRLDRDSMIDYIQTGEASIGTIIFFIIASFITPKAFPVLMLAILIMIFAELIYYTISELNLKNKLLNGLLANGILILCILFLMLKNNILIPIDINLFLFGYGHVLSSHTPSVILVMIFITALYSFYLYFAKKIPETALISQGNEYFTVPGISYSTTRALLCVIKGFLICLTIFFLGWLAGISRYLQSADNRNNLHGEAITILVSFIIIQAMLILAIFIEIHYIVLSILVGSYIIFGYRKRTGRTLYDRD